MEWHLISDYCVDVIQHVHFNNFRYEQLSPQAKNSDFNAAAGHECLTWGLAACDILFINWFMIILELNYF